MVECLSETETGTVVVRLMSLNILHSGLKKLSTLSAKFLLWCYEDCR